MEVLINNNPLFVINTQLTGADLKQIINEVGLFPEQYYLLANGKCVEDCNVIRDVRVHIVPRVLGGKGGFGSMLRAIGAQIEKTTNREACRDLSGRRLRDINEEQRLKNWINQQADREKEAKERKQKKLERLCERPKHEFKDEEYDKERSALPENVEDAVLQGLQASCSSKRAAVEKKPVVKKKKPKLWVDDELDEELTTSSSDEEEDYETVETKEPTKEKVSVGIQKDPELNTQINKRGILKYALDDAVKESDKPPEAFASKQPKEDKESGVKALEKVERGQDKKRDELPEKYEGRKEELVKPETKVDGREKFEKKRVDMEKYDKKIEPDKDEKKKVQFPPQTIVGESGKYERKKVDTEKYDKKIDPDQHEKKKESPSEKKVDEREKYERKRVETEKHEIKIGADKYEKKKDESPKPEVKKVNPEKYGKKKDTSV